MREIIFTHQFKKDLKLARKRNLPEDKLNEVVFNLANDIPLPAERKDHNLTGKHLNTIFLARNCYALRILLDTDQRTDLNITHPSVF